MIHPTCLEVLATVQSTFTRDIVPKLSDVEARSAAATIEHLLRHVALRIEHEGSLLTQDIARLVALLGDIAGWMESHDGDAAAAIRATLAAEAKAAGAYRGLDALGEGALRLRGALVEAQKLIYPRVTADPRAAELRTRVQRYIGEQLADEAKLIEPAFSGRGPRR